jgi:hypothetical protein
MVAFPDMRVLMDDLLMHGDKAEYRWTLVGTNTGPGGTGRCVRISGFEEWSIGDDGLIAASLGQLRPSRVRTPARAGCKRAAVGIADQPTDGAL